MVFLKGIMHTQVRCGSHSSSQVFMMSFTMFSFLTITNKRTTQQ